LSLPDSPLGETSTKSTVEAVDVDVVGLGGCCRVADDEAGVDVQERDAGEHQVVRQGVGHAQERSSAVPGPEHQGPRTLAVSSVPTAQNLAPVP
jgi:hypothetical protein